MVMVAIERQLVSIVVKCLDPGATHPAFVSFMTLDKKSDISLC